MRRVLVLAAALGMSAAALAADDPDGAVGVTQPVRAGTVLEPEMLAPLDAGARGDVSRFVGLAARRNLWPGRALGFDDIGPPLVVHRNAVVSLMVRTAVLEIVDEGRALDSGGIGEAVRVMNLSSQSVVRGVVTGPALVEVRP